MADELNLESLEGMGKADYIKAFKNKSLWKKATAVIFMVDYKLDGKKTVIALPFKKEAEMKLKMKEIKKNKTHLMKKTGGGSITVENDGPEGLQAKVELKLGGLNPFILQDKAAELFDKIKATLKVLVAEDAEMETEEEEVGSAPEKDAKVSGEKPSTTTEEEQPVKGDDKNKDVKLTIAKIVKLNKLINLKDGLQDTDLKNAEALKAAIRDFAALLKTADAATRTEFGETFLKTKKLYAKLEEEIKKLKEQQSAVNSELDKELNDALGEESSEEETEGEVAETEEEEEVEEEEEEEEEVAEPKSKKEALARNQELMDEINATLKEVDIFAMA